MTDEVKGKAAGGYARAAKLTPEQRSADASAAAKARWTPRATHQGNFKAEFGLDVECFVLDDAAKTPVISQSGMGRALGLAPRGNAFPRFIASKAMENFVGADLREKLEKVLIFQWRFGGAGNQPAATVHGYDAALLIDVCKAILAADAADALKPHQAQVAAQARLIVSASAKSGIRGLVYALAGYNPTAEEVIAAFKLYVMQEAKKYEAEFPSELYLAWHRLYSIPVPVRGNPWQFKHLTLKHVYYPLAKSSGRILELLRAEKARDGDRQKKLFQFLSEIGARALRIQLGRVLEMAESSASAIEYERKITTRFGDQQELDLIPLATPSQ